MNIQDLYPIVDDLLYSKHTNIDIALPYYNKKKEVGPKLIKIFKDMNIYYESETPTEWKVYVGSTKGDWKTINFVSHNTVRNSRGRANIIIITDDRED